VRQSAVNRFAAAPVAGIRGVRVSEIQEKYPVIPQNPLDFRKYLHKMRDVQFRRWL
jgi:hypothetical protein